MSTENGAVAAAVAAAEVGVVVVVVVVADGVADSDVGLVARRRRGGPVDGLLPLFSIGSQLSSGLGSVIGTEVIIIITTWLTVLDSRRAVL